ncbi:Crp/Fnr family transcriptional regulator [Aquimarina litoralis]|uniref:Crp/Fnr family transcriptional regulator n=1 Tax=Aquimarina litoralis TaxID=584605 RepID=UPI001C5802A0|nr:Crp/Fnr family transcriptional regulator [Aquimarina litoralis]MBW1294784.1 cyclic nucleotide-binding domain-containing protein [Aquimarina litoralis]
MQEITNHIKSIVSISDQKLSIILNKLTLKEFSKKEHLLNINQYTKEVYFIVKGCTRTYVYDLNGVEHNITFAMENWWFGDLQSFIKETPASFNIQALEPTTTLSISKGNWDYLVKEIPEFAMYTRVLFRNTMFSHENRILQNLSFTAEERYSFFLKKYPNLAQRISQKHMASYLGITPEFLSMLRNKIRK